MNHDEQPGGVAAEYEPPRLTVHGSIIDLTRAAAAGTVTDRAFPAGTPVTGLTFSS